MLADVHERVRIEADPFTADERERQPQQRKDQRPADDSPAGLLPRPEDQPPDDTEQRSERVQDEVRDGTPAGQVVGATSTRWYTMPVTAMQSTPFNRKVLKTADWRSCGLQCEQ